MEHGNAASNLLRNLTKKQKIGIIAIIAVFVLAISLIAIISSSIQGGANNGHNDNNESQPTNSGETPAAITYNEEHKYTLLDYLPASNYSYILYGDGQYGTREYWWVEENTAVEKGIVASVDSCDVEGNTAAVREFLKTLPVDLSEYTIVYQTHTSEVPCDVP